jgi:hypothetical protein
MTPAEVYAGLSAIKSAFDMTKGLKDIHDVTLRDRAVIELQEKLLAAQATQSELVEHIHALEQKVTEFETWDSEKKRYELKCITWGVFAYMLKPEERGVRPPHWACTNCYEHKHVAIVQYGVMKYGHGLDWFCPSCKTTYRAAEEPKWLD